LRQQGGDFGEDGGVSARDLVLGFGLPVSGVWATPENVAGIARRAEDLGYGSLWTYQRILAPAEVDWGPQYRSVLDPVVALAYSAAVTRRARLGTAVINAPFLPAAVLARQLASLDVLSGGRLDAGLGLGWAEEEFRAVGFPRARRAARLEDTLGALHALWSPDPVEFHGEFTDVPPSRFLPKPVQRPRPPILLGGTAEPALRRAGRLADGWISSSRFDLTQIETAVATVRAAASDAGRDADALRFVVRGVVRLGDDVRDGRRLPLTGPADAVREDLGRLHERGVTEVFLDLNFVPRVGSPDADPADALDHAHEVLETFAPAASS
jgi:probable F420-dependent oxidoreductase